MSRWMVMVIAMMFPLVLDSARTAASRSLWSRRHRALAWFLLGYLGPWMIFGGAACLLVGFAQTRGWYSTSMAASAGFGMALAWQFTAWKRLGLHSCHRTQPLAPRGWPADRDCFLYGWAVSRGCLLSCWALMLACLLAGHGLAVMVCTSAVCATERYFARPEERALCGAVSMGALSYAALCVL